MKGLVSFLCMKIQGGGTTSLPPSADAHRCNQSVISNNEYIAYGLRQRGAVSPLDFHTWQMV